VSETKLKVAWQIDWYYHWATGMERKIWILPWCNATEIDLHQGCICHEDFESTYSKRKFYLHCGDSILIL